VKCTVTNSYGKTGSSEISVEVIANLVADFTFIPEAPKVGETVTFTSASSGKISSYSWSMGDGTTLTGNVVSHVYGSKGSYTVVLTVKDVRGTSSQQSKTLAVVEQPIAAFTFTPTKPYINEIVTFDAGASTPGSGTITAYVWNFGDGSEQSVTTATVTHSYGVQGVYSISLYIINSYNLKSEVKYQSVTVNVKPLANFIMSGNRVVGSELTFDASTSQGSITSYVWDFGDVSGATEIIVKHAYSDARTYTAKLTVTDGVTSDTATQDLAITSIPPNVQILTTLQFPPSTEVGVEILVTHATTGVPLSGQSVSLSILPVSAVGFSGISKSGITGTDGKVLITFLSPPSSAYTYDVVVTCSGTTVNTIMKIFPKLSIRQVSFSAIQVYKPGEYDFSYEGEIIDKESATSVSEAILKSLILNDSEGRIVPEQFIHPIELLGSRFIVRARLYDYYASVVPDFSYQEKTLTFSVNFGKEGYMDGGLIVSVKMTPPTVVAVVSKTRVTLGDISIKVAFKDSFGNPYTALMSDNVEVIVTSPTGISMSTLTDLADKYYFDATTKTMTISYTFNEEGQYKLTVKYVGMPFEQPPQTFTITSSPGLAVPPILTNPYFLGFIVFIVIIVLMRRRRRKS